jgi:GAF domain-containing protein
MICKERVVGVIEVINKTRGAFTVHDQEILEALGSSAALAIENARLVGSLKQKLNALR